VDLITNVLNCAYFQDFDYLFFYVGAPIKKSTQE